MVFRFVKYLYLRDGDVGQESGIGLYSDEDGSEFVLKTGDLFREELSFYDITRDIPGLTKTFDDNITFEKNGVELLPRRDGICMHRYTGDLSDLIGARSLVSETKCVEPPFRIKEILPQMVGLLTSLDMLHDIRIAHGDIKPKNILYDRDGRLYLTDFGISRVYSEEEMNTFSEYKEGYSAASPTKEIADNLRVDVLPGTFLYGSPENHQAFVRTRIPRYPVSDIWSLGCVFFEMLTGFVFNNSTFRRSEDGEITRFYSKMTRNQSCILDKVTNDMKREFPREKEEIYSPILSLINIQRSAAAISDADEQNIKDLFAGMLDPNFLTRLSAKECLENPLFKDYLYISRDMRKYGERGYCRGLEKGL